jgi:hypothetical protein
LIYFQQSSSTESVPVNFDSKSKSHSSAGGGSARVAGGVKIEPSISEAIATLGKSPSPDTLADVTGAVLVAIKKPSAVITAKFFASAKAVLKFCITASDAFEQQGNCKEASSFAEAQRILATVITLSKDDMYFELLSKVPDLQAAEQGCAKCNLALSSRLKTIRWTYNCICSYNIVMSSFDTSCRLSILELQQEIDAAVVEIMRSVQTFKDQSSKILDIALKSKWLILANDQSLVDSVHSEAAQLTSFYSLIQAGFSLQVLHDAGLKMSFKTQLLACGDHSIIMDHKFHDTKLYCLHCRKSVIDHGNYKQETWESIGGFVSIWDASSNLPTKQSQFLIHGHKDMSCMSSFGKPAIAVSKSFIFIAYLETVEVWQKSEAEMAASSPAFITALKLTFPLTRNYIRRFESSESRLAVLCEDSSRYGSPPLCCVFDTTVCPPVWRCEFSVPKLSNVMQRIQYDGSRLHTVDTVDLTGIAMVKDVVVMIHGCCLTCEDTTPAQHVNSVLLDDRHLMHSLHRYQNGLQLSQGYIVKWESMGFINQGNQIAVCLMYEGGGYFKDLCIVDTSSFPFKIVRHASYQLDSASLDMRGISTAAISECGTVMFLGVKDSSAVDAQSGALRHDVGCAACLDLTTTESMCVPFVMHDPQRFYDDHKSYFVSAPHCLIMVREEGIFLFD